MTRPQHLLILPALLALTLAGPAFANGLEGHRPLKDRPCLSDCRQQARTCLDAARTAARLCAQTTCSAELAAANTACATDPESDACGTARRTAYACLAPCREALKGDLTKCRSDTNSCVAACPDRQPTPAPTPRDQACVSGCRQGFGTCAKTAQDTAQECRSACSSLVQAARMACVTNQRRSQACRDALQAAYACLRPCNQALETSTRTCLSMAHDCVASCPDANQSGEQP